MCHAPFFLCVSLGPLSSRSLNNVASAPTNNLYNVICETARSEKNLLDLLTKHGGRLPGLQQPRSLYHIERYMFDAAKYLSAKGALLKARAADSTLQLARLVCDCSAMRVFFATPWPGALPCDQQPAGRFVYAASC